MTVWAEGDEPDHPGDILDASGKIVTPEALAHLIQNVPGYKPGQTVIIMACFGGHTPDSIAQRVSNFLPNALVYGAADEIQGWGNGTITVQHNQPFYNFYNGKGVDLDGVYVSKLPSQ